MASMRWPPDRLNELGLRFGASDDTALAPPQGAFTCERPGAELIRSANSGSYSAARFARCALNLCRLPARQPIQIWRPFG